MTHDAIKPTSKTAIQNTAEATGDLIGNKISDKITKASSQRSKQIKLNKEIPKERYISPVKKQQITDQLRLI